MFKIVFLVIAAIILYKLIFDFVLPIYRTSRQIKQKFREMNRHAEDQMNGFGQGAASPQKEQKPVKKDYIDFEEIK